MNTYWIDSVDGELFSSSVDANTEQDALKQCLQENKADLEELVMLHPDLNLVALEVQRIALPFDLESYVKKLIDYQLNEKYEVCQDSIDEFKQSWGALWISRKAELENEVQKFINQKLTDAGVKVDNLQKAGRTLGRYSLKELLTKEPLQVG